ncbi:hypothetical protein [Methylobacterium sp. CM6246]
MEADVMAPQEPAIYRLQCVIHRESVSGIIIQGEQIIEHTEEAAVTKAKSRFSHLLAGRTGCAALRNDAGQIVWSTQQAEAPAVQAPSLASS